MRPMLALSCLALALSACADKAPPAQPPRVDANVAASGSTEPPELIPRDVLFGNPERANVQVSPDGKELAWIAPVDGVLNVWVAPIDALDTARAITADTTRGIRQYFWSHRPGTLLYLRDTGGDEDFHLFAVDTLGGAARDLTPFPKTRAMVVEIGHRFPDSILVGMNDRDAKWHDLYRVDLATGERTLVYRNVDDIAGFVADGAYALRFGERSRPDGGTDLLQRDGEGWKTVEEVPYEDYLSTGFAGMTDDGRTLYLHESRGRDTTALVAIDTASRRKTVVFEDPRADLYQTLVHPGSGVVQAASSEYLREEWKALDPAVSADLAAIRAIGPGDAMVASRSQDDRTWIVSYFAADKPVEYHRYARDPGKGGGTLTRLFGSRPALEGKPLANQWPREIPARDGKTLVSYLTLPREADANGDGAADRPSPMVLLVHGGPWSRDGYGIDREVQWLANRGYAVLQVNYRGSTGFGKAFVNASEGQWGKAMHDDLIDGVDWAVKAGVTTKDQVAIMGGSYGGYATLVGMTMTPDAFRCGVDIVGPSNLVTLFKTFPSYWASFMEQWYRRVGDPRTEAGMQALVQASPITHVANIKRPLLIGQGANDPRVVQAESDQIVAAMQEKKIPVTYVLFPDEGHGFARPENAKAFNAVAEGFLGECLGGRVEPIGTDFTGSSITVPAGADGVPGLSEALSSHEASIRR